MASVPWFRVTAFSLILVALPSAPATAFPWAEFPTQMKGSRGEDTRAVQHLLTYRGFATTADGVFGSGTDTNVKAFQLSRQLPEDGVVGPETWSKLVATMALGNTGSAVRAVQSLLNAKRDPSSPAWPTVTVDGVFGSGTRSAVQAFQSHMGLTADGVVGPETWRNLTWHYERLVPSTSHQCLVPSSWDKSRIWGVGNAKGWFQRATSTFNGFTGRKVAFQDLSKEHGGPISGHSTHQRGMDLDVELMHKTASQQCNMPPYLVYTDPNYDRSLTTTLSLYLIAGASGSAPDPRWVEVIYFNDLAVRNDVNFYYPGVMEPLSGHNDHLHVRWCVAYYPLSTTPSYFPGGGSYDC